ncbi:MAG: UDP-N-acetylmuramoyl-tripeptide--D-alanyl-D-alanine ligase [Oscillospiraceae bacterium]|nr:UDP-N-acetylmuramoyl-tripeptide--D-alanyl-D-alanine ligase [Oscillospiraceae bacterium]
MDIVLYISVGVIAASGLFALCRQLQMLQQSSYYPSRYWGWLKGAIRVRTNLALMGFLLFIGSAWPSTTYNRCVIFVLAALSLIRIKLCFSDRRKSIKKLVFTDRIKRTFVAAAVFLAALITVGILLGESSLDQNSIVNAGFLQYILFTICAFFSFIAPATCLVAWAITYPIEQMGARWYVNDAKKILKNMPDLKVIGVTGSYGKTSTKFILGRILNEKFNVVVTPESFNTPMGVVRTVRDKIQPQTQIFIAEMGAKNKGDIKEICEIADPTIGIITSVGPQHLDTFGNIETITSTKFELADWCQNKNGKVFLNADNEIIKARSANYNSVLYGTTETCDCRAENIVYGPSGLSFNIISGNSEFKVSTKLLGVHNALNITAAAAVALDLGVSCDDIAFAVSQLKPVNHRLEMKSYLGGSTLIDDAYNANPEGCLEAVRILGSFGDMKKIIVTPGLVELGEKEYECNRRLGEEAAIYADIIILVGPKRAVPIAEGVKSRGFNEENLHIVQSFAEARKLFTPMCDNNTVIIFENDLPDNYAG